MTAQLVTDALMMAIWLHRAILQHSAQTLGYLSPVEFERKVGLA